MSALARPQIPGSPTGEQRALPADAARERPDALAALRAATRDIHARLDAGLPLAREGATLNDYRLHLRAIGGWLAALDCPTAGPDMPRGWEQRQTLRLALIAQDLRDCEGQDPLRAGHRHGAPEAARPDAQGFARDMSGIPGFAWGVAYVVEGSQLGGTVLYRRLHTRLAPHPLRYLQGGDGGTGWPAFVTELRQAVATPPRTATACAGALAAFGLLIEHFNCLGVAA